jgi:glycosyltransferase involved in cell wall biosynthesis
MAMRDRATDGLRVSVIVPARNEEASIALCLQSLVEQDGIGFEIVVVDDGSTDRTRQIAESFAGVRVMSPPPLPPHWTGKNNAVAAGAKTALGPWLLLTDADTIHRPGSLARALAEAERRGVALLSYSPQQEVVGFWEKAVMPVIFAELASRYRPSEVSDPASAVAAANGQYILVSRAAYDAVGGHAEIAPSLLEDVALARMVKDSGRKIFFRYGGDVVCTRMYRSFRQLSEGWTKNLALLFPSPGRLAFVRTLEFLLIPLGAAWGLILGFAGERSLALVAWALVVALYALFWKRIGKAHFSRDASVVALLGLPLFSYLLLRSKVAHAKGEVSWKGRDYRSAACALRSEPLRKPFARASS